MATLLRLADADLRDAALLEAGRDPGNAPVLAGQAVTRMVHAVVATEVGWPLGAGDGDLDGIPDLNPLKRQFASLQQRLPSTTPPMPLRDGQAPPAPDHEKPPRTLPRSPDAVGRSLAERFQVDLRGNGPAGRVVPVRPEPSPAPRPPPMPKPPGRNIPKFSKPTQDVTSERLPRPQKPSVPKLREGTIAAPSAIRGVGPKPSRTFAATPFAPAPKADRVPAPVTVAKQPQQTEALHAAEPHVVGGPSAIQPRARPGGVSSTVFWSLMDRWEVSVTDALRLVGHAGGLTKKGTRPRFKLDGDEIEAFLGLQEIDTALEALKLRPTSWLRLPIKEQPFSGTDPLAFLAREALAGIRVTLRFLLQSGLRMSMTA